MFQLPDQFYKRVALLSLSVFFIFAGVNHFLNPDFYITIMPPYLPFHRELNIVCGFFEILGGIMVLKKNNRKKNKKNIKKKRQYSKKNYKRKK